MPNEDEHSNEGESHNDLVTINVTNEMGQTKMHGGDLANGYVDETSPVKHYLKLFLFGFSDKNDVDDNDITDMHHHIGIHHKVGIKSYQVT